MKILAADDREDALYLLDTILTDDGHDVTTVFNGQEALIKLNNQSFDLVLSDILMPEMDGFSLCFETKTDELLKYIPFVFITAMYISDSDRNYAFSLGADHFIKKPVDVDRLTKVVGSIENALARGEYRPRPVSGIQSFNETHLKAVLKNAQQKSQELETLLKKQIETKNALQESENIFRRIFEDSVDGMFLGDNTGNFIRVSKSFSKLLGYSEKELLTMKTTDITYPEDITQHKVIEGQLFEGERDDFTFEKRYVHKNGDIIWSDTTVYAIRNPDGNIKITVGRLRDISERKRAEEKLNESLKRENLWSNLVRIANIGVSVSYHDGRIGETNHAYQKMTGYSEQELQSIKWNTVLTPPEWLESEMANLELIRKTKKPVIYEKEYIRKNGDRIPIELVVHPAFDRDGNIDSYHSFVMDISDRKNAEKEKETLQRQILQSQKFESLGNLAGGIAHDFNNILTSIIGFTELALDDVVQDSTLKDNLKEIHTAGTRAKELVNQILAFARQSDEEIKSIRIDIIIEEVLHLIRSSIPTYIEIKKDIGSESLIMGNQTQVHQIMMNLCTNAAQAMEEDGGTLEVSLQDITLDERLSEKLNLKRGRYIRLLVSDTGTGIPPENMDLIFEPYFTTKGTGEGTGMGLAMVQGIIESYGGQITVDSDLAEGTTFTVYIPVTKKHDSQHLYETHQLPTGTERILIVDDEASIAKMVSQRLESLGYRVTARTNSVDALELFRSKPQTFDLVLTDMTMPKIAGNKLAIELMKIRPEIPVILCTGYSNKISAESATDIGVKAFVFKPFIKADLAKTIRKVLDASKSAAHD